MNENMSNLDEDYKFTEVSCTSPIQRTLERTTKQQLSVRALGFPMLPGPRWAKIHLVLLRYITGR